MILPRRALLGARLAPDLEAFSPEGALVASVVPGSMADAAGVAAGDRIARVAGLPVRCLAELAAALRAAGAGDTAELTWSRAGDARVSTVPVQRCPVETIPGACVSYEALEVPGARLRSIVTHEEGAAPQPAVLVLQGIACESIDFGADPDAPLGRLVRAWAEAGFATMRVDRRGVGDSEGGPCGDCDFETDLGDHRAALEALLADPRVDPSQVFLFGHSVGGMVAPLLAAERAVRGVLVYGTSPVKWLECVVASTRRQLAIRSVAPSEIDRRAADLRARLRVDPPSGRSAAYHRQLDALDLEEAWRRVRCPVLILRGEHDWVVAPEEQARIAALSAGTADVVDLPRLDHMLTAHGSLAESMAAYGEGRPDSAMATETIAWLRAHSIPSSS